MVAWKPLLAFGGSTLVDATLAQALGAAAFGLDLRVILVAGYRGEELAAHVSGGAQRAAPGSRAGSGEAPGRVLVVHNARWEEGMLGSIQAALPLVRSPFFFTIPADMPLVGPEVYARLAAAREAAFPRARAGEGRPGEGEARPEEARPGEGRAGEGDGPVLFAAYRGEAGHPVLIPSRLIPGILALEPSAKLRPFLMASGASLVECGSPAVLADIDSPSDYLKARGAGG
jgi:molybdenum cofactor cytidylyltransferase